MNSKTQFLSVGCTVLLWISLAGCGGSASLTPAEQQELQSLRADNAEVQRLRKDNKELARLRRDNQEVQRLQNLAGEIARLQSENERLRNQLSAYPALRQPPAPPTPIPAQDELIPIQDLVSAFEEAAIVVESQGIAQAADLPMEGDNILIDQSVIELLIPEFKDNTNGGPYEMSGWLTSKGVTLKNYQQFNYLGITNYHIRRAPSEAVKQQSDTN